MNEIMKAMAERIASQIRLTNIFVGNYENCRDCQFYSEWQGLEMALETMGINYKYEYNYNGNNELVITAVIVDGQRAVI